MVSLEEEVEEFIRANRENLLSRDEPQRAQLLADRFQIVSTRLKNYTTALRDTLMKNDADFNQATATLSFYEIMRPFNVE